MSESSTARLTMAQALVRYLAAQQTDIDGQRVPLFAGCFAIFGHGNVAGMGEALYAHREAFPTWRAHNEQAMAHAATAFARQSQRRRMMACTTSIGPGALNMVTAAGVAHANRLPVLLLPGDTFATRRPDPVLQQVEHYGAPSITVNDAFVPVSRYFDRINRPEQLLASLPTAIDTLLDPVDCGPATLALPQDVQAEAWDFPASFFEPRVRRIRRAGLDELELASAVEAIKQAKKPLIIAGGGVLYSGASDQLARFAGEHGVPVAETQAGKGSLRADHPNNVGSIGVTGGTAANTLAEQADVIIALGTRLQDFTTGSRALYMDHGPTLVGVNVARFDAVKHGGQSLIGDAAVALDALTSGLSDWQSDAAWQSKLADERSAWLDIVERVTAEDGSSRPADSQVLGAVNRAAGENGTVVCAAGGLPGELHKNYRTTGPGSYHVEYGFSCMGYEIAGGLGAKMAAPERDVFVMVGDGSYLMLNSELATSVMLGRKLIVVLLDNRGYGCIHRLQGATVGVEYNNLFDEGCNTAETGAPDIDFAAHARSLGCEAEWVDGIAGLEAAIERARSNDRTTVIALKTDPDKETVEGGAWWDVPVAEVSSREAVTERRAGYDESKRRQR